MDNIKNIIKINDELTAIKSQCIGIKINSSKKNVTVTKVNKKSFIASNIKFTICKVINLNSYGLPRNDGKQTAIFRSDLDGVISIEF